METISSPTLRPSRLLAGLSALWLLPLASRAWACGSGEDILLMLLVAAGPPFLLAWAITHKVLDGFLRAPESSPAGEEWTPSGIFPGKAKGPESGGCESEGGRREMPISLDRPVSFLAAGFCFGLFLILLAPLHLYISDGLDFLVRLTGISLLGPILGFFLYSLFFDCFYRGFRRVLPGKMR